MSKPRRTCVFCDATGLTYEHVWADWLKRYLTMDIAEHTTSAIVEWPTYAKRQERRYSGDPRRRRLRVVCERCNTGWMREVQDWARPTLLPLLNGASTTMDKYAQTSIAAWATMASMAAEFYEPRAVAVPFHEREHLRLHREPPKNWRLWIGNYPRKDWVPHWVHRVLPIYPADELPEVRADGTDRPNTQTTTFVVGQLYIYAVSSETKIFEKWADVGASAGSLLSRIWPTSNTPITWPPPRPMTDLEADRLADAFYQVATAQWRA